MTEINRILSETRHRPFSYPTENWEYYQEWNNALFLHWKVPVDLLRQVVPEKLIINTFEGNAYISLVAFTMQKIRPRNLPSVKFISEFGEINLRTYIKNNNKNGVYFLSIEAEKPLSVFIARTLSGLPYEKSSIQRTDKNYLSTNIQRGFYLNAAFEVKELLSEKQS